MATSLYKAQNALKTCSEHEHQELSYFCRTCKKFICTTCVKTTHNGHDWDLISHVAKSRRVETPILCRRIRQDSLPKYRQKVHSIDGNISTVENEKDKDISKLEKRRTDIINMINQVIDDKKKIREEIAGSEIMKIVKEKHILSNKVEYLEKISKSLDVKIREYSDYDMIEMEQEMLTVEKELESYRNESDSMSVEVRLGELNREILEEMVGEIKQNKTAYINDDVVVHKVKSFTVSENAVINIVPKSNTQAWFDDSEIGIKLLTVKRSGGMEIETRILPPFNYFTVLANGDIIATDTENQVIREVKPDGTDTIIASTKPLLPRWVGKTKAGEILVNLRDDGDNYNLTPSSRRLVQRMTTSGKVLHTYEFREDGATRLFTWPGRTAENVNSDICAINLLSEDSSELIVIRIDGRVRCTYRGIDSHNKFRPLGVACDSDGRILVADHANQTLHLLSPDCRFLRYLSSGMVAGPTVIALSQSKLWVGYPFGIMEVYKYTA